MEGEEVEEEEEEGGTEKEEIKIQHQNQVSSYRSFKG